MYAYHSHDDHLPLRAGAPSHSRKSPRMWWGGFSILVVACFFLSAFHSERLFCSDKAVLLETDDAIGGDDYEERLPLQESPDVRSRREELRQRFIRISGQQALDDPTSFQYKTWQWLADAHKPDTQENLDERYVITLLYLSTEGNSWAHPSCNILTQETICDGSCQYSGVLCDEDQHIVHMNWAGTHRLALTGSLVTEIGYLTHLTHLNLHTNRLEGDLPTELGHLTRLKTLILDENRFEGDLPSELARLTDLELLSFSINNFSNQFPTNFGALTNLKSLQLQHNKWGGAIPTSLGELTKLTSLSLLDNQFSGTIPDDLSRLTNLKELNLAVNALDGSIPTSLEALAPSLTSLGLWQNLFNDRTVPASLEPFSPLLRPFLRNKMAKEAAAAKAA